MEQNQYLSTKYAAMVTEGHKVTWVMRPNAQPWGLIIDNEIKRK